MSRSKSNAWILILLSLLSSQTAHPQTVSKILGADGTNLADVVPGNTAPAATKKALVVTISPNSPAPAGSQDVNLIKVGGVAVALGQTVMTASLPVAIASNQTALAITASSLPLPTGAATEATLATRAADSTITARLNTLGQKTMANSAPVALASDQSAIPASQSGTWTVQQGGAPWSVTGTASDNSANSTAKLPVIGARANAAAPLWTEGNQAPLSVDLGGLLRTYMGSWLGSTAPTVGQKADGASLPVTLSTGQVGAAGVPASGVFSIQGIANMTAVKSDGTGSTGCTRTVVSTSTTTTVKATPGVICFLYWTAGVGSSLAVYDNGAGGTTNQFVSRGTASDSMQEFGPYGMTLTSGVTAVTTGGTPAFVVFGTK
jgi:hypothetical protein